MTGEWERWYLDKRPEAIREATERILKTLAHFRASMDLINRDTIERWVRDLVIVKTFLGLRFHEAILKRGAQMLGNTYRPADPREESAGIDGFIGETPVSIKPTSYRAKASLPEEITGCIIWYKKVPDGIEVDYSELQSR